MKKVIIGLSILYTSMSFGSQYYIPPQEVDFLVPDYPAKIKLYVPNPQMHCVQKGTSVIGCTVPTPSDGIISQTHITVGVSFQHVDDTSKYCTYELDAVFSTAQSAYAFSSPPAKLASASIPCDNNYYTTSPFYTYKVNY